MTEQPENEQPVTVTTPPSDAQPAAEAATDQQPRAYQDAVTSFKVKVYQFADDASLPQLRRRAAQMRALLPRMEHAVKVARLAAEQAAINDPERGYAALKNETERARLLGLAVEESAEYVAVYEVEQEVRFELAILDAEITVREDARKDGQAGQRERELALKAEELELRGGELEHAERQHELALEVHELEVRRQDYNDATLAQQQQVTDLMRRQMDEADGTALADFPQHRIGRS
jgi:hypothetical protein